MKVRFREAAAVAIAALAFALGFVAAASPATARGVTIGYDNGRVLVASVARGSAGDLLGLRPGMVVYSINGLSFGDLPEDQRRAVVETLSSNPDAIESIDTLNYNAAVAPLGSSTEAKASGERPLFYALGPSPWLGAIDDARHGSWPALPLGLGFFFAGLWWLRRQRDILGTMALTLPVAVAVPVLLLPVERYPQLPAILACAILLPLSQLPLAMDFADQIDSVRLRRALLGLAVLLGAAGAIVYGLEPAEPAARATRVLLALAVSLLPGLVAAVAVRQAAQLGRNEPGARRMLDWIETGLAALTPAVAIVPLQDVSMSNIYPIVGWVALVVAARTLALRPLVRIATRATLGRDVALAATEAERARIAADIHDDVLQDVTMLVRRLDAAGDAENADSAREIAARLRSICGELRLPILDDLGVGPALEWLMSRYEPLVHGPIYLERLQDEPRLPSRVELAVFRVAQEALTNAARHGRAPIAVRYRSGGTWCELYVDDSGPGLPAGAAEAAEAAGHFGLLNMTQRAEQIAAEFVVGRRPGGGTRVSLVWEAAARDAQPTGLVAGPAGPAARTAEAEAEAAP